MKAAATMMMLVLPFLGGAALAQGQPPNDAAFADTAAAGNYAEIATGQLAVQKAADADVKAFGQRMVTDHGKANQDLQAAVAAIDAANLDLPQGPTDEQQAMAAKLGQLSGAEFDRAYIEHMVADHEKTVGLFRSEAMGGKEQHLRDFAKATLPVLEEHLRMARSLAGQVGVDMKSETRMPSDAHDNDAMDTDAHDDH
jgi:putative membrane protein